MSDNDAINFAFGKTPEQPADDGKGGLAPMGVVTKDDPNASFYETETQAADKKPTVEQEVAAIAKDLPEDSYDHAEDADVIYSSHPIKRFKCANKQFEDGTLTLSAEDAKKFDKYLDSTPRDKQRIQKITMEAANRLVAASQTRSQTTMGTTTSQHGRRAMDTIKKADIEARATAEQQGAIAEQLEDAKAGEKVEGGGKVIEHDHPEIENPKVSAQDARDAGDSREETIDPKGPTTKD